MGRGKYRDKNNNKLSCGDMILDEENFLWKVYTDKRGKLRAKCHDLIGDIGGYRLYCCCKNGKIIGNKRNRQDIINIDDEMLIATNGWNITDAMDWISNSNSIDVSGIEYKYANSTIGIWVETDSDEDSRISEKFKNCSDLYYDSKSDTTLDKISHNPNVGDIKYSCDGSYYVYKGIKSVIASEGNSDYPLIIGTKDR